jgi:hypothetical protein
MGVVEQKKIRSYKPKKKNEIKLNSYLIKRNGESNKLGESIL